MPVEVSQKELDEFFHCALDLVKEAGQMVRSAIQEDKQVETKASFADLVTETDKGVEKLLISKLSEKFPGHSFIGEESTAGGTKNDLTDNPTWIIDPVDGTMNFVHTFPMVAVSVALAINKEIALGFIYNPVLELLYTARKGRGAFVNDAKLKVSSCTDLAKAVVMSEAGSGRDQERIDLIFQNMKNILPRAHGIRSLGSACMNMVMVAGGNADAYQEFGIHCWDIAAGKIIVEEAGGYVCDMNGGPLDLMARRVLCASSRELAEQIVKLVKYMELERD
ncbi:inositol monophosphatase 1 [Galendromus occidentalis]|uniref:Inositol-1-monophosphatase n=1 Tax=Galendromus occidentalis TaxID=34638 RepID=A0AAJ6QTU0_9ACAR|nr:inositol monophosphatase 1 [Galendromus occidentalis]